MIPRLIHAYWHGGPLPDEWAAVLEHWRKLHRDWNVVLWMDEARPPLQSGLMGKYQDHEVWSPKSNPGQHRANLMRLDLLWRYGGVWVDVDLLPLRPIDALVVGLECFAAWEQDGVFINNAFMGAERAHPAIGALIDAVPARLQRMKRSRSNRSTGPHLLTELWKGRGDVTILPQRQVYPYGWREAHDPPAINGDAWLVHKWANRLRTLEDK